MSIETQSIEAQLRELSAAAIKAVYNKNLDKKSIQINETRKDFEGDLTLVIFPLLKSLEKKNPVEVGEALGKHLTDNSPEIKGFNVVKGFLNLSFSDAFWLKHLETIAANKQYGNAPAKNKTVVLEYCGPNTNKPLHLGHLRNMVLGYSVANLLKANGYKVHKVNILNDRGIAICKSMLAWQKYGNGETPKSSGIKGDHLVGKYYVMFAQKLKEEYQQWQQTHEAVKLWIDWMVEKEAIKLEKAGNDIADLKKHFFSKYQNEYFNKNSQLGTEARGMLLKWEAKDKEIRKLWETMNSWVYAGFNETYDRLGIDFEEAYKESEMYESGKKIVQDGLKNKTFYQKEDGSIWADLTAQKLDHKILLRSDGTSVYLTQDLGVAQARYNKYKMDSSVYTVGNEQEYHFKALKGVLTKMGLPYADGIFHLSYGMVDLPSGKMKSREGTVVDADDLIADVVEKAKEETMKSGKIDDFSTEEASQLFEMLGTGAIRFFMLQVNPKKGMLFDPVQSVQMEGFTSPFIQYSYARIQSVLRKYGKQAPAKVAVESINGIEQELIQMLSQFPKTVASAGEAYDPSEVAHYTYHLSKTFNKFYANCPILKDDVEAKTQDFRILLCEETAKVIQKGLGLLGIDTPERM